MMQPRKPIVKRAFRGLAGSPLAEIDEPVPHSAQREVEPPPLTRVAYLIPPPPRSIMRTDVLPSTIWEWREKYAHLLNDEIDYGTGDSRDKLSKKDYKRLAKDIDLKSGYNPIGQMMIKREPNRPVPMWMTYNDAINDLLRIAFPKLEPDRDVDKQGKWMRQAMLWRHVIHGIVEGRSAAQIAHEWNWLHYTNDERSDRSPFTAAERKGTWTVRDPRTRKESTVKWEPPKGSLPAPETNTDAARIRRVIQQITYLTQGLTANGKPRKRPDGVEDKGVI